MRPLTGGKSTAKSGEAELILSRHTFTGKEGTGSTSGTLGDGQRDKKKKKKASGTGLLVGVKP